MDLDKIFRGPLLQRIQPPNPGGQAGAVSTVFGRSGDVIALSGDYSAAQVTNAVSTIGSYADPTWLTSLGWAKLAGVPLTFAPSAHTHPASDIVSGVITAARLGTGTTDATTYLRGDGAWVTAPQTPWVGNIDGNSKILSNPAKIIIGTATDAGAFALQVTGSSVLTGNVTFSPDNTYDIGASGATRPKNVYIAGQLTIASTINGSAGITCGAGNGFIIANRSKITSPIDGKFLFSNQAGTTFTALCFGTATSSFPSLKVNGTTSSILDVRLGDDSGYTQLNVGTLGVNSTVLFDQGVTARGRVSQVSASHQVYILANSFFNSTWQRDDTGSPSSAIALYASSSSTQVEMRYVAAGSGAITWASPFTFDLANNVESIIGTRPTLLLDQGVTARSRVHQYAASHCLALTANLYSDGVNWNHDDVSAAGMSLVFNAGTGMFNVQRAPAGANPATPATKFQIDSANGYMYASCAGAALDTPMWNNSFYAYVNEAGNTLTFRVKYSTGTIKQGTIALA